MHLPSVTILVAIVLASELALAISKRSAPATGRDRRTLPTLWIVITLSIWLAFELRARLPEARLPAPEMFYLVGFCIFALGLVIRWTSIIYLGRFFTVNVAIARDHQLITTGPYRFVRHPSYTGAFLKYLGLGLCMQNFCSLIALMVPISLVLAWRIHVEETALCDAFGEKYLVYAAQTCRVLPLVW